MKNYVLVHGAWGEATEFDALKKHLSADGSAVHTLDLPGHGQNKRAIAEVTMTAYVQTVTDFVNSLSGSVILAGHSLGGMIISQVAESIPSKIDRLIYICAMLPRNGDSALALMQSDDDGQLLSRLTFSEDQSYVTMDETTVKEILLHDVTDADVLAHATPVFSIKQATQPFAAEAQLTNENFGRVPKVYIHTSLDRVLSPALQTRLRTHWPVEEVISLNAGHFPLISVPEKLSAAIKAASLTTLNVAV